MQRESLSRYAIILLLVIFLFAIITQRVMLTSESSDKINIFDIFNPLFQSNNEIDSSAKSSMLPPRKFGQIIKEVKKNSSISNTNIIFSNNTLNSHSVVDKLIDKSSNNNENNKIIKNNKQKFVVPLESSISQYHPQVSPRIGTDISPEHQLTLLRCQNQSRCIIPDLQLQSKIKVYFCKHPVRHGVRFYYLAQEGLLLHPNVELVTYDNINTADLIIYLPGSAPWHKTECSNSTFANKFIVLDEFDGHSLFAPFSNIEEGKAIYGNELYWYYMYFKRSYITRRDGIFIKFPHINTRDVYPMMYSLADAYMQYSFNMQREIDVLCTLRGHKAMGTRLRVQEWVAEFAKNRSTLNIIAGELNTGTRTEINKGYFQRMYNSKIIVTVNPADWEGDFRLWESLASGALIFVDPLFVPYAPQLVDGKHIIYFSNHNKSELLEKLDYYTKHTDLAKEIAHNGYLFAMKYHRTVSMIDYILRSAHLKLSIDQPEKYGRVYTSSYYNTAQYLVREARNQEKDIKKYHRPGNFSIGF